jgi:hypothetical protein
MNVYWINPMRTRPSFAKSLSTALTVLALLGSSATVFADDKAEPAKEQAATSSASATEQALAAPAEPAKPTKKEVSVTASSAPATEATTASDEPPADEAVVAPDPASITEVGIQRLPGSAFPTPQTRGIAYGSLSLTFHGLQWPYMPATAKGSRFVIGLSGWAWIDNSYEKFAPWGENQNLQASKIKYWIQQARLVMRATPTYSFDNDWFIQGQAEFVATEDQTIDRSKTGAADTDDLWLRIGQWNKWDFMIGRYEGWEVFHLGMGLDFNTFERTGANGGGDGLSIKFYGVTDNQYRPEGAAGNLAFHYYPLRYLRFELLSTLGSLSGSPIVATRPVAILDLGWLKLKAGTEYQRVSGQQADDKTKETRKGVGAAIQFVFEPHIEFGFNAAQGTSWVIKSDGIFQPASSLTRTSFGGFANLSNGNRKHPLIFGVGALYTHNVDQDDKHSMGIVNDYWHLQTFVAVQYVAFQKLYIKLVGGYARAHWDTSDPYSYSDEVYSARLRFSFYF